MSNERAASNSIFDATNLSNANIVTISSTKSQPKKKSKKKRRKAKNKKMLMEANPVKISGELLELDDWTNLP